MMNTAQTVSERTFHTKNTGAVAITATDEGAPKVSRTAIARARGRALDAVAAKVGVLRMRNESDHALQARTLSIASDWGMLAREV